MRGKLVLNKGLNFSNMTYKSGNHGRMALLLLWNNWPCRYIYEKQYASAKKI